jgi:hypothetical protein
MGSDSRRRRPFLPFVAGALLYAAAAASCIAAGVQGPHVLEWLTPLFGLPFLVLSRRAGWPLAAYLLLLVPAFHFLAIQAALHTTRWPEGSLFLAGLAGGLVGSTLSFGALVALRLHRPGPVAGTIAAGVSILALLGGLGLWRMEFLKGTAASDYGFLLSLYVPWQVAFGWFLAALLRPAGTDAPARS